MEDHLSTRQVAEALKVSESSVKRWCNRGVIPTVRTVGGHRRIPLSGLMAFLEDTNRELATPIVAPSGDEEPIMALDDQRAMFLECLSAADIDKCRQVVTAWYTKTKSFASVADQLIATAFHQIGEKWECGELEVYQERQSCEICTRLLSEFHRILPNAPENAPLAIGGAPEGDHYSLPSQLAELVLRECGWKTLNLGPNLPLKTLLAAVTNHKPRILWISASHIADPDEFAIEFGEMHEALPADLMTVVGGRALNDALRPKMKYNVHCDNMQQLASFAKAFLGSPRRITTSDN